MIFNVTKNDQGLCVSIQKNTSVTGEKSEVIVPVKCQITPEIEQFINNILNPVMQSIFNDMDFKK